MNTGTFIFMIATYWVGGSGSMEGGKFLANGQVYRNNEFVAAHRTLPLGTILHVCLRRHCVSVVVKDRGPFLPRMDIERRIDLSYGAAKALDMLQDGRQRVRVSVPTPQPRPDIEPNWQEASSPDSKKTLIFSIDPRSAQSAKSRARSCGSNTSKMGLCSACVTNGFVPGDCFPCTILVPFPDASERQCRCTANRGTISVLQAVEGAHVRTAKANRRARP